MPATLPGQMHQRDYKSQQTLGPGLGGGAISGSELGGALALRLGNACGQWPGGSRCEPMGAGRSPPAPGQKQGPRRLREAGALLAVGGDLGPVY